MNRVSRIHFLSVFFEEREAVRRLPPTRDTGEERAARFSVDGALLLALQLGAAARLLQCALARLGLGLVRAGRPHQRRRYRRRDL
jgi:hypothetical protein